LHTSLIAHPPPTPLPPLSPYTTLFRSKQCKGSYNSYYRRPSIARKGAERLLINSFCFIESLIEASMKALNKTLLFTIFTLVFRLDRKSTRLNSSHVSISYAVFCFIKTK